MSSKDESRIFGGIESLKSPLGLVSLAAEDENRTDDQVLERHGVDVVGLQTLSLDEQAKEYIRMCGWRIRSMHDNREFAKMIAFDRVLDLLIKHPADTSDAIFSACSASDPSSVRYVPVIEELYELLIRHVENMRASSAPKALEEFQRVLLPFGDAAKRAKEKIENEDGAFLAYDTFRVFLSHVSHLDSSIRKFKQGRPFLISEDTYALFSVDENRIYIAPAEMTNRIKKDPDSYDLFNDILDQGKLLRASDLGLEEEELDQFVNMLQPEIQSGIKFYLQLEPATLSLREQVQIFKFLSIVRISNLDRVQSFIQKFGGKGMRAFLAGVVDEKIPELLLELAEDNPEAAHKVFEAFEKFADMVKDMREYVVHAGLSVRGPEEIEIHILEFLKRGRMLLAKAHEYRDDPRKIELLLQRYTSEGQLLLTTFKYLKAQGKLSSLKEVRSVTQSVRSGRTVLEEGDAKEYAALYRQNRSGEKNQAWVEELVRKFEDNLSHEGAEMHEVRFQGKLIAFMLATPRPDGSFWLSALNAETEISETNVGLQLVADVITQYVSRGKSVAFDATVKRMRQYKSILPMMIPVPVVFTDEAPKRYEDGTEMPSVSISAA